MPRASAPPVQKKAPAKKGGYKLAEKFSSGEKLEDLIKKRWLLGSVIGQGGFGLIYLAWEDTPTEATSRDYVIKIEPKNNGPLFCEMQFYQKAARQNYIDAFIKHHKLHYLGVPPFISTGQHEYNSREYRFLVMPRFGTDLQKLLEEGGGTFPAHTAFALGLRMIDALQYLHEREYVHADIKASNILLGYANGAVVTNEVFLVDYGLAYRYTVDGIHKEYKEDPRKAHDGTIEFTSRDAHKGVAPSRRGDLEILGYCLLQWLCGWLPWQDNLSDPSYVASSKEKYMRNVQDLVSACRLSGTKTSECMLKYLAAVAALQYDTTPDYGLLRKIMREGMVKAGQKDEWKLDFANRGKAKKRKSDQGGPPAGSPKKSPGKPSVSPAKKSKSESAKTPKQKKSTSTPRPSSGSKVHKSPQVKKSVPKKAGARASPKKTLAKVSLKKKLTPARPAVPSQAYRVPVSTVRSSPRRVLHNGAAVTKRAKVFSVPPPSKPSPRAGSAPKTTAGAKGKATRKVRKPATAVLQTSACVQTSPSLQDSW